MAPLRQGVGGDRVQVELYGVGAGLLHELGVVDPAAGCRAVDARDDRDCQRGLRGRRELDVPSRPDVVELQRWKEVGGLGKGQRAGLEPFVQPQ
jgi:hypothetical protein